MKMSLVFRENKPFGRKMLILFKIRALAMAMDMAMDMATINARHKYIKNDPK
jgi:hypothetical protein